MAKQKMGLGDLGGLVYSTESGRMCPDCRHQLDDCICTNETIPEGDGIVRIHRETKGRKGKGVSLIQGVLATDSELKKLAKTLKSKCGVGGTVRDGVIEIQTDRRDLLKSELEQLGYAVKLAGG